MAPDVEHLLDAVRRGEIPAFEALVRALTGPLYGYVAAMLRDPAAAEEVVQETLIQVYRRRRGLSRGGTLRGYCYRAATNLALNRVRDSKLRRKREQEAASMKAADDPHEQALGREAWRMADDLPEELRATLHLRYGQGLTIAETAQAMQVPEGTVSTRQRKALQTLRERMALTLALVPTLGLEETLASAQPASQAVSNATITRMEALVMASIGTKAATNTAILVAAAILLSLGGVATAIVVWPASPPPPAIATQYPTPISNSESKPEPAMPEAPATSAQPEEAAQAEPPPDKPEEEPANDVDLLHELRARYEAQDRPGFAETEAKCKAAQPWDFDVLLPFFQEIVHGLLKRWHAREYRQSDVALESALIDLAMNAIESEDGARAQHLMDWTIETVRTNPQKEAKNVRIQANDLRAPQNVDADVLGMLAARLIKHCGYGQTRSFVQTIFGFAKLDDAVRYARMQIPMAEALGDIKAKEARGVLERLYFNAPLHSVKTAVFAALMAIFGPEYAQVETDRLIEMLDTSKSMPWDHFKGRYVSLVIHSPTAKTALDSIEGIFARMDELEMPEYRVLEWAFKRGVETRYYMQRKSGVDEGHEILQRFDQSKSLGVVSALLLAITDAYAGSNDAVARRVLRDKAQRFEEYGWTNFEQTIALANVLGTLWRVSNDTAQCLRLLADEFYPAMHEWALPGLDSGLSTLVSVHLAREPGWSSTHERAMAIMFQRLEGTGEFAFGAPARYDCLPADTFATLNRPEVRQALEIKVAETTDESLRAFYEEALAAWVKKNG